MLEDGTLTTKAIKDRYEITTKDAFHTVGENFTQNIEKQAFFKHGLTIIKSQASIYLDAETRVQVNAPILAYNGLLTGPKADIEEGFFENLHVVNVIDGTAAFALRIGNKSGASFSVEEFNAAIELGQEKTTMKKPVVMKYPLEIGQGGTKFDILPVTNGDQIDRIACVFDPKDSLWKSIRDGSIVTPPSDGGPSSGE